MLPAEPQYSGLHPDDPVPRSLLVEAKPCLDAEGELAVGDDSLEAAAAGAEEPAVPRRLGQPDLDLDGWNRSSGSASP